MQWRQSISLKEQLSLFHWIGSALKCKEERNAAVHRKCGAVFVQYFANMNFKNRYPLKILSMFSILNIFESNCGINKKMEQVDLLL